MASWKPVDIDQADRDGIGEEDDKWDDNLLNELETRFEEPRRFNETLKIPSDKDADIMLDKLKLKKDMIKLVANQILIK